MTGGEIVRLVFFDRVGKSFVCRVSTEWTVRRLKVFLCEAGFGRKGQLKLEPKDLTLTLSSSPLTDKLRLCDYSLAPGSVLGLQVPDADERVAPGSTPKWLQVAGLEPVSFPLAMIADQRKATGELVAEAFQKACAIHDCVKLEDATGWGVDSAGDGTLGRRVVALLQRERREQARSDGDATGLSVDERRPPVRGECVPHTVHDGLKAALKLLYPKDGRSSSQGVSDILSKSIGHACKLVREALLALDTPSGLKVDECKETRWGSYARGALQLAVQAPLLGKYLLQHFGVTDASGLAGLDWKDRRAYQLVTEPAWVLSLFVLGELHHYLAQPTLDWANAASSLRFDQIGAKVLELGAALLLETADRRKFFPNSFAYAASKGYEAAAVDDLVHQHVTAFMDYMLNRLDFVRRAPWCYTFFFSKYHRARLAQSILDELDVYRTSQNAAGREAFELCDTLGFRHDQALVDALQDVADGCKELPSLLHERIARVHGALTFGQAAAENDVKICQWLIENQFKRPFILSCLFFLYGLPFDLTEDILKAFPDDSAELTELRKLIRGKKAAEKEERTRADAAPPSVVIAPDDAADVFDKTTSAKDEAAATRRRVQGAVLAAGRAGAGAISNLQPLALGSACAVCGAPSPLRAKLCDDYDCEERFCAFCAFNACNQRAAPRKCPACDEPFDEVEVELHGAHPTYSVEPEQPVAPAPAAAPPKKAAPACSFCQDMFGVRFTGHRRPRCPFNLVANDDTTPAPASAGRGNRYAVAHSDDPTLFLGETGYANSLSDHKGPAMSQLYAM